MNVPASFRSLLTFARRGGLSALGVEEQRVNVLIDLDDPPERWTALGDGYRVEASIEVWRAADALQVPAGAVFQGNTVPASNNGPINNGNLWDIRTFDVSALEASAVISVFALVRFATSAPKRSSMLQPGANGDSTVPLILFGHRHRELASLILSKSRPSLAHVTPAIMKMLATTLNIRVFILSLLFS